MFVQEGTASPITGSLFTYSLEVTAGYYRLNSDKTYRRSTTTRRTEDGVVSTDTETGTGTFRVSGSSLTFKYCDVWVPPGCFFDGSLVRRTLTIGSSVYVKP